MIYSRAFISIIWCTVLFLFSNNIRKVSSAPSISISSTLSPSNAKIVIIGAGASGIAAGVRLFDYGFEDITILEAESRIGGRIHTIPFGDNVVDMGAQWCHGEKNNVVYELVKDLNPFGSTEEMYKNTTMVRSNGDTLPHDLVDELIKLTEEIYSKRHNESLLISVSAHEFMKNELDNLLQRPEYRHINRDIAKEFLGAREQEECSLEASDDLNNIPARGDIEYEQCEGSQVLTWKDKGYESFLQILMKSKERGMKNGILENIIKTSKKVKNINWQRDDAKVLITLNDDKTILADHVIVTVSLGVLKEDHDNLFDPKLPNKKLTAIREINFGSVGKVFMEFKEKSWPSNWCGISLLWMENDLKNIRGTSSFWWEGITGYYAVDYQPRVLEVWLIGSFSRHMETLNIKDVQKTLEELLDFNVQWNLTDVINIVKTNWYSNPNFRGTYSYHSIQTLESGVSPRDLEEPLTIMITGCTDESKEIEINCEKPVVLFAGEATNVHHYSTVHGAVESGWREADRLAKLYNLNDL